MTSPHPAATRRQLTKRHSVVVRVTHWLNAVCLLLMLMSGLQIFNAHPMLYWGQYGANSDPAFIVIGSEARPGGPHGFFRIGSAQVGTTGVLGVSKLDGQPTQRAFPGWATIPSYQDLGTGRYWHFFFAWVLCANALVYIVSGLLKRHIQRDLVPDRDQLTRKHLWHEILDHARLRFPKGGVEARRYNALQKITYLLVLFGLLPLIVLTGLTMSPGMDAAWPWLLHLFGGRQSARTLHFLGMSLLVGFVVLHVFLVLVSGVWNSMRSMLTGWYAVEDAVVAGEPAVTIHPAAENPGGNLAPEATSLLPTPNAP